MCPRSRSCIIARRRRIRCSARRAPARAVIWARRRRFPARSMMRWRRSGFRFQSCRSESRPSATPSRSRKIRKSKIRRSKVRKSKIRKRRSSNDHRLPRASRTSRAARCHPRREGKLPSVKLIEEGGSLGFAFAGNKPTRPVSKPLSDISARLQWLDTNKIERQVVGGWLDMFGNELPAEEGTRWSRLINTHLLQAAKEQPRFIPLAAVPLQDGARAAEVLKEAHGQGFKGAMIGTQPKGKGGVLDDPTLLPFWETANSLGSIVFIHPVFESGDDRVHDYGMANAVG